MGRQNHRRLFVRAAASPQREGSSLPWGKDGWEPSLLSSHMPKLPISPVPHKGGNAQTARHTCVPLSPWQQAPDRDIHTYCSPRPPCAEQGIGQVTPYGKKSPLMVSIPLISKHNGKRVQVQQPPAIVAAPWPHGDVMRDTAAR